MQSPLPMRWAIVFLIVAVNVVILVTTLFGDDETTTADDKRCQPEELAKLDDSIRSSVTDACVRSGEFTPSTGKEW